MGLGREVAEEFGVVERGDDRDQRADPGQRAVVAAAAAAQAVPGVVHGQRGGQHHVGAGDRVGSAGFFLWFLQAARAGELVESVGQPFEYQSFPQMTHSMHGADPALFARTVTQWASALPAEAG